MDDTSRVVPIPFLNADEIQVLLHGLTHISPDLYSVKRRLDTFTSEELRLHVHALSTALLEALEEARR